jgi:hypothetical protein
VHRSLKLGSTKVVPQGECVAEVMRVAGAGLEGLREAAASRLFLAALTLRIAQKISLAPPPNSGNLAPAKGDNLAQPLNA